MMISGFQPFLRIISGKGDDNYERYIAELEDLFDEYSENDIVTMKNNTTVYIGGIL